MKCFFSSSFLLWCVCVCSRSRIWDPSPLSGWFVLKNVFLHTFSFSNTLNDTVGEDRAFKAKTEHSSLQVAWRTSVWHFRTNRKTCNNLYCLPSHWERFYQECWRRFRSMINHLFWIICFVTELSLLWRNIKAFNWDFKSQFIESTLYFKVRHSIRLIYLPLNCKSDPSMRYILSQGRSPTTGNHCVKVANLD